MYIRNLLFVSFPERKIRSCHVYIQFLLYFIFYNQYASCLENAAPARSPIPLTTGGFLQKVADGRARR